MGAAGVILTATNTLIAELAQASRVPSVSVESLAPVSSQPMTCALRSVAAITSPARAQRVSDRRFADLQAEQLGHLSAEPVIGDRVVMVQIGQYRLDRGAKP